MGHVKKSNEGLWRFVPPADGVPSEASTIFPEPKRESCFIEIPDLNADKINTENDLIDDLIIEEDASEADEAGEYPDGSLTIEAYEKKQGTH